MILNTVFRMALRGRIVGIFVAAGDVSLFDCEDSKELKWCLTDEEWFALLEQAQYHGYDYETWYYPNEAEDDESPDDPPDEARNSTHAAQIEYVIRLSVIVRKTTLTAEEHKQAMLSELTLAIQQGVLTKHDLTAEVQYSLG